MLNIWNKICKDNGFDFIPLSMVYANNVINIFTDASMTGSKDKGCYGYLVVNKDTILNQYYMIKNGVNNYTLEALAIRNALLEAAYIKRARYNEDNLVINIFTDALSVLMAIESHNYITKFDNNRDSYFLYHKHADRFVPDADIINDCITIRNELLQHVVLNILWIPSHLYDNISGKLIKENKCKFKDKNNLFIHPTESLIMYLSRFNADIDMVSRNFVREMEYRDRVYSISAKRSPIRFMPKNVPIEFYDQRKKVKF